MNKEHIKKNTNKFPGEDGFIMQSFPEWESDIEQRNNHFKRTPLITVDVEWTPRYCWYIIPTIEINTSVKEVALNVWCLGIYFSWRRY